MSLVLSESTREESLLDLPFMNREGLMGGCDSRCLCHSEHEMVEFKILSVIRKKKTADLLSWPLGGQTSSHSVSYSAEYSQNLLLRA